MYVVLFLQGSAVSQSCLLESGDVDFKLAQLAVIDGCLTGVIDVVKAL